MSGHVGSFPMWGVLRVDSDAGVVVSSRGSIKHNHPEYWRIVTDACFNLGKNRFVEQCHGH